MAAYHVALKARKAQIAAAKAQLPLRRRVAADVATRGAATARRVRVVNLPPLTITRTS